MKINPREEIIYGWESPRSLENTISMMIGLVNRDEIPPVRLWTFNKGKTFESEFIRSECYLQDGGHHRLIGAYLLGIPIEVKINDFEGLRSKKIGISRIDKIKISRIKLVSDLKRYFRDSCQIKRELPGTDEFFSDYIEINYALKNGIRDYSFTKEKYQKMLNRIKEIKSAREWKYGW